MTPPFEKHFFLFPGEDILALLLYYTESAQSLQALL